MRILLRRFLLAWLILPWLAWAGSLNLESKQLRIHDGQIHLDARFGLKLPGKADEYLRRGVSLTFSQRFELVRLHRFWLDTAEVANERTVVLSYLPVQNRYRVLIGKAEETFDSQAAALHAVATIQGWVINPQEAFVRTEGKYEARLRLRLEANQLPQTLQLSTFFAADWDIDSGWQNWKPAL